MKRYRSNTGRTVVLFLIAVVVGLLLSYTEIYIATFSFTDFKSAKHWISEERDSKWQVILKFEHTVNTSTSVLQQAQSSNVLKDSSFTEGIEPTNLLNMSNFKFLSTYSSLCRNYTIKDKQSASDRQTDKLFLIIIQSSRKNHILRKAIRKTWGSVQPDSKSWSVRTLFLMGIDPFNQYDSPQDDPVLDQELSEFGDLVIGNFLDTWKNNSYKTLSGLKWALEYCPIADFVFITSDNVYVNVNQFIKYREDDLEKNPPPNMYCGLTRFQEPVRCSECDYFVDVDAFPLAVYPDYCSGIGFGFTMDLARKLYSVSNSVRFVWISDVFVTGILMEAAIAKFGEDMQVVQRELWENDITVNVREEELDTYCSEYGQTGVTERFKNLVSVPKGYKFERHMMCLLNKG